MFFLFTDATESQMSAVCEKYFRRNEIITTNRTPDAYGVL